MSYKKACSIYLFYILGFSLVFILALPLHGRSQEINIPLHWVFNGSPVSANGVSWGVPLERGKVKGNSVFKLTDPKGSALPLQSWPMAYWPDGSLKWIGLAASVSPDNSNAPLELKVSEGKETNTTGSQIVTEKGDYYLINNGVLSCRIPKKGDILIDALKNGEELIGAEGRLVGILTKKSSQNNIYADDAIQYSGDIDTILLEQNGPVRALVSIKGRMTDGNSSVLPFTLRVYFYKDVPNFRLVYNFIYDVTDSRLSVKGLGFSMNVPLKGELYNRHVQMSGEDGGVWHEPVQPLVGRRKILMQQQDVFTKQIAGETLPSKESFPSYAVNLMKDLPAWDSYKITQLTSNQFEIWKRTNPESSWIKAGSGTRSDGMVYIGDSRGGLGIGTKDFWEKMPASFEIDGATKNTAQIHAWLWSPEGEAMDLRHYDTTAHGLEATYEDVEKGFSTPYGISNRSELTIFAFDRIPSVNEVHQDIKISSHPPLLSATSEWIHRTKTLGYWSLPDTSTAGKRWIEEQLNTLISYYKLEVNQRDWYGFWNYGDFMHAYDSVRHSWMYDIGGFAWDNTELATPLWLWYHYLRSGKKSDFTLAEAMTRHTSEVDVYHKGRFVGLGSRHNVIHWGGGAKEVRMSQALYHRPYYYLTTDERTGEIMKLVADSADFSMAVTDPLRKILPKSKYPTHARIGPDWLALVGNWMIEWERTGDKKWLGYIKAGINSFAKMPFGFFSGEQGAFGYDPKTKKVYRLNDDLGSAHLTVLMGGPEVAFELTDLIDNKEWDKLWLQYSRYYGASKGEMMKAFGKTGNLGNSGVWYARLPAYYGFRTQDEHYKDKAWNDFLDKRSKDWFRIKNVPASEYFKTIKEMPKISTNTAAQWSLNAIELLDLIGDDMPSENELWNRP